MSIIRISNLRLRTIIGIKDEERENRQDVVINVAIEVDTEKAGESDDIDDAVNYKTITKSIIKEIEGSDYFLLEKLANSVLRLITKNSKIRKATVKIDKPSALRFADSVSIEVSSEK